MPGTNSGLLWLIVVVPLAGCRPAAEIRSYTVPREDRAASVRSSEQTATHHMLAAVVPIGEKAWFFKVVGTVDQTATIVEEFKTFLAGLEFDEGEGQLQWTLPEGWTEEQGRGMRTATISISVEESSLEMSVLSLPWTGEGPGGLLANVNRWRGQMRLPPVGPAGLAECTSTLDEAGLPVTLVDLLGQWQEPNMSTANVPNAQELARSSGDAPVDRSTAPATDSSPEPALDFQAPDDWQLVDVSGFRKAAYRVDRDGEQAEITVMDFAAAAGSAMADPLANVNRWRGQVGLGVIDAAELQTLAIKVDIASQPGTLVELFSPAGEEQALGLVAAMVELEGRVWFFKMFGDRAVVESQRDAFREFLSTVRFDS